MPKRNSSSCSYFSRRRVYDVIRRCRSRREHVVERERARAARTSSSRPPSPRSTRVVARSDRPASACAGQVLLQELAAHREHQPVLARVLEAPDRRSGSCRPGAGSCGRRPAATPTPRRSRRALEARGPDRRASAGEASSSARSCCFQTASPRRPKRVPIGTLSSPPRATAVPLLVQLERHGGAWPVVQCGSKKTKPPGVVCTGNAGRGGAGRTSPTRPAPAAEQRRVRANGVDDHAPDEVRPGCRRCGSPGPSPLKTPAE